MCVKYVCVCVGYTQFHFTCRLNVSLLLLLLDNVRRIYINKARYFLFLFGRWLLDETAPPALDCRDKLR